MISGLSHITLIVEDLERTAEWLKNIFDAQEVYSSGEAMFSLSQEKFFLIGALWICIMRGKPPIERSYHHIAFQIQEDDYDGYLAKLRAAGVEIKPGRPRIPGEGRSLYFYDFDNHLFELHTGSLADRLKEYRKDNRA